MNSYNNPHARYQMIFNPAAAADLRDRAGSDHYLDRAVIDTVDGAMVRPIVWWADDEFQRGLPAKARTSGARAIERLPDGSLRCQVEFNGPAQGSIADKAEAQKICPGLFVAVAINDYYRTGHAKTGARVSVKPLGALPPDAVTSPSDHPTGP